MRSTPEMFIPATLAEPESLFYIWPLQDPEVLIERRPALESGSVQEDGGQERRSDRGQLGAHERLVGARRPYERPDGVVAVAERVERAALDRLEHGVDELAALSQRLPVHDEHELR